MSYPTKKIGEIIELKYGKGISRIDRSDEGKYPIYGANGILGKTNKVLASGEAIIIGRKGSAGEVMRISGKFWPSDVTYYVSGNNQVDLDYLFYFFKDVDLTQFAVGVKPGINRNRVYELEIPLPSLDIQKKIVKKIEDLFSKIDQAQNLRASAAQDADNLVPAAIDQILEKGIRAGWKEYAIGELVSDLQAGFACGKSNKVSNGIVHLRTHNIDLSGDLNLDKIIKIPKNLVNSAAYGLKKGDVLFNNTNSTELVGKTIIIRQDLPYAFSNHINRMRFNASVAMPEWVLFIFQKYWREKYFESICTRWVGQSGINQGRLVTIKIPLPPIAEQKKIVARLDALTQKVRALQQLQNETEKDLSDLKKSILHKAFTGELR